MKVNIPQMLRDRRIFGDVLVSFVSYKSDDDTVCPDMDTVFPNGDYESCELVVTMNGVEVPAEIIEHLFVRYVKHYAAEIVKNDIADHTDAIYEASRKLTDVIDEAANKIIEEHGLDDDCVGW